MDDEERGIKAIHRFDDVVDLLRDRGPLSTRAVANELGVANSTAHAYLSAMIDREYVVKRSGGYALSLKFLDHGMTMRERLPIVREAESTLEQLAADTSEAAYLVVEEHGQAVYVDYALGERAVRTHARTGTRAPLHSLASGKAILAHLPDDRVTEILDRRGLPALTENTITDPDRLREELATVRERGYAVNQHEANEGTHAIAAPVVVDDEVLGSVTVAGPANRITIDRLETSVASDVLAAANEIELVLAPITPD